MTTKTLALIHKPGENDPSTKPERRKPVSIKDRMTSVYPSERAIEILGGKQSSLLNLAIECWATRLKLAERKVQLVLKGRGLGLIRQLLADRKPDPTDPLIGTILAAVCREQLGDKGEALAQWLEEVDYVEVWAAIWLANEEK